MCLAQTIVTFSLQVCHVFGSCILASIPATQDRQNFSILSILSGCDEAMALFGNGCRHRPLSGHHIMWSCARSIKQASCMCAQAAVDADERETCWGALDVLRGCSAGMVYHDLQQHCCIPFRALEGMDCLWCARQSSPCTQSDLLESNLVDTHRP